MHILRMEQPAAGSHGTAFHNSFPHHGVPDHHALKLSFNNHVTGSVHLGGERKVIVLALRAPSNPIPKRQRQTFWTACASCKEKNKYPIEHLNCSISCLHCRRSFKAVEVSRPRRTSINNVEHGASFALSRTMQESAGNATSSSAATKSPNGAPRRKKHRSSVNLTKGGPLQNRFSKDNIRMLLKFKGKEILEEGIKETMRAKNKPTPR